MNEHGTAFVHAGAGAAKPFHYTQCGLDDVWLLNGFTLSDTAYGPAFSIKDMDVLHKAIGLALVRGRKTFGGKDVRFLRRQMQLTQNQLGALIGVGDQMVAHSRSLGDAAAVAIPHNRSGRRRDGARSQAVAGGYGGHG
jgi:DNA-binding transcriptional regulator YiaG